MNLDDLRKLAGITEFKGMQPWEGSNISVTGNERGEIMKRDNIRPGDADWFKLWFGLPYMTGEQYRPVNMPPGFRNRKK